MFHAYLQIAAALTLVWGVASTRITPPWLSIIAKTWALALAVALASINLAKTGWLP